MRPGYKQTEFGVIPEDWEYLPLGDVIFDLRGGAPFKPTDFTKDGVWVLPKGGVIRGGFLNVEEKDQQFCSESYAMQYSRNQVDNTFIIVVLRDLVPSGPSIGLMVKIGNDNRYVLAQGVYGFKTTPKVHPEYLIQFSNSYPYRKLMNEVMVGSTQVHVTNTAFRKIQLPFPSLKEQRAIAAALSDVDGLLAGLDRLIAKKRAVKTAVMQQLLTGEVRVGEGNENGRWSTRKLGEIADLIKGSGLSKSALTNSGQNQCILYGELFTTYERIIDRVISATNSDEGVSSKSGDVLMPGSTTTTGEDLATASALLVDNVKLGGDINIIRQKAKTYDPVFLAYCLTVVCKKAITELAQGITIIHLYGRNLAGLELKMPAIEEQNAIAAILSDIDAEIAALETRRAKTAAIKQGMMQELLTGRTRLV